MNPRHHRCRDYQKSKPLHVVLKTAHSYFVNGRRKRAVENILTLQAVKFGVRIYHGVVHRNHIHLLVLTSEKEALSSFLRVVLGMISKLFRRKLGLESLVKFWLVRPFSRIVHWGRDYKQTVRYFAINKLENLGVSRKEVQELQIQTILKQKLTQTFQITFTKSDSAQLCFHGL